MYSFAKEKHSGKGILSTILGTLSLVIFAVLAWLAYYLDGQGGVYLGSIGLWMQVVPLRERLSLPVLFSPSFHRQSFKGYSKVMPYELFHTSYSRNSSLAFP